MYQNEKDNDDMADIYVYIYIFDALAQSRHMTYKGTKHLSSLYQGRDKGLFVGH